MKMPLRFIFFIGFVFLFPGVSQAASGSVLVAAASSMKFPFDEMIVAFEREHPEIDVKISYASSGALFSQIKNGAPFDILFSADELYPGELEKLKLASPVEKTEIYALGQIALWMPQGSAKKPAIAGLEVLLSGEIRKISIANPRHAPYGRAAIQAMQKAGVYEQVKEKLVFGENVSQAAQFTSTGAAQAGLFAYSVALAPAMQNAGAHWLIPSQYYDPIQHARLILKTGNNVAGAREFAKFVSGARGAVILQKYGFLEVQPQ
jgi:molybdate transport system substrate-binding protein